MGLRYVIGDDRVAMYDSVTEWAFGPVFLTEEGIERFLDWAENQGVKDGDVRALTTTELSALWNTYAQQAEDPRG